jgi:hypothetical protein
VADAGLPSYDELPVREGLPAGSSWGLWGDDDRLGCLNLLTPERVRRAASCVRDGEVFSLNLELELPSPPLFGRSAPDHVVHGGRMGNDDELDGWNTQSSTQWDGFRHIRHPVHGHYNGIPDEEHGVAHWARRGVAGRAVLADVARWREAAGRPISPATKDFVEPDEIRQTLASQGVELEVGDILLLRTGWLSWYRGLGPEGRSELGAQRIVSACGLRPGVGTARALWDMHVSAVAADNPALEAFPPGPFSRERLAELERDPESAAELMLHFSLLPLLGLPIGELFDLDALARRCHSDGRYESFFSSAPLNLAGGVASPPNALAIR